MFLGFYFSFQFLTSFGGELEEPYSTVTGKRKGGPS